MFQPEAAERDVQMNSWLTRSFTHPPATGIGGFLFCCKEKVILSQSWAGTGEKRLAWAGGAWPPPGRRVSEGAV